MARIVQESNCLHDIHEEMIQLSKRFREEVCEKCRWSEATYYRKAKGKNSLSEAEKYTILRVADKLLKRAAKNTVTQNSAA